MSRAWAGVVVFACACGPGAAPAGETTDAQDDGTTSGSASATSASDSSVTASSNASSDPSTSTSSSSDDDGQDDEVPKWDHPAHDFQQWTCPVDLVANAEAVGSSPLGPVDMRYAWFGTGGGGKCPYGYDVMLLPSTDGALEQLDDVNGQGQGLKLFVALPGHDAPGTGRFPLFVNHRTADEVVYAEGTAIIDTVDGEALHGTFVVDDPAWTLEGEFFATWCELLDSGPCGAIGPD